MIKPSFFTFSAHALTWIDAHELPSGGICAHAHVDQAYPEVTGYLIPTLLQYRKRELVARLASWLISIQKADGSYGGPMPDGESYIFDTGQALRGLLEALNTVPEARQAARRAASYLYTQMLDQGQGGFVERYAGEIPESVHLYVLQPLLLAADAFQKSAYCAAAQNCLEYYLAQKYTLQDSTLTHYLGYELEALIELNRVDLALPMLDKLCKQQAADGAVRALEGARWVCLPGVAQLACCWYKVGYWKAAHKALDWLEQHQQPNGGFLGSYGPGAIYYPADELSWTTKFYLDAHRLRIRWFMERQVGTFPAVGDDVVG